MFRVTASHSTLLQERNSRIRQHKMRTVLCIVSLTGTCFAIFALTAATPLPSTIAPDDFATPALYAPVGEINGSKLVITQVVKTVEFVVGIEEDDNETSTSDPLDATTRFLETEIQVLNPELLKQVVAAQEELAKASSVASESSDTSSTEATDKSIDGTKEPANETS